VLNSPWNRSPPQTETSPSVFLDEPPEEPPPEPLAPQEIWDHWIEDMRQNVRNDGDSLVLLTARKNGGKSTLALRAGIDLDSDYSLDKPFPKAKLAGNLETFVTALEAGRRGDVIVYDDALSGTMGTKAMRPDLQALISIFSVNRFRHLHVFMLTQSYRREGVFLREDAPDYWWAIPVKGERERCFVHTPAAGIRYDDSGPVWRKARTFNPITWSSLKGTKSWNTYRRASRSMKEAAETAAVAEARGFHERLLKMQMQKGEAPHARAPLVCHFCQREWGSPYELRRHEARCKAVRPA
jgi:hypothetical protein